MTDKLATLIKVRSLLEMLQDEDLKYCLKHYFDKFRRGFLKDNIEKHSKIINNECKELHYRKALLQIIKLHREVNPELKSLQMKNLWGVAGEHEEAAFDLINKIENLFSELLEEAERA